MIKELNLKYQTDEDINADQLYKNNIIDYFTNKKKIL